MITYNRKRSTRFLAGLALSLVLMQGCAVNPVSGEREFMLVSEDQEIAMGAEGAAGVEQSIGLVDDTALQQYVQGLGLKLAADSERPALPWSFGVIDDPSPNAFAFPGGYIFITRGLMALMDNEAELVSVLGHEIGHVTARHSAAMMSRAQVAQIGLGVGSILSPEVAQFGELAAGGLSLLFLSYGRDAERQADDLGFQYALAHGYDVREMVNVFAALQHAGEIAGASPLPNWLASHPHPEERIERIQSQLDTLEQPLGQARVGQNDYMNHIDGLTFGTDPRQGYFEDNHFLHPELEFHVTFPKGWRTQNLPQAVMAGSPEEDAVMQLTLAPDSAVEAANKFFSAQGLTAGRVDEQTINELPVIIGPFQAETQNGTIGGIAAFIRHHEKTFRLVAFTPVQQLDHHGPSFSAAINSFGRLTDAAALARQPDRITIVQTEQAMTLATFNEQYPSVVDMNILAMINQVSGPNATIPAGSLVKRITGDDHRP